VQETNVSVYELMKATKLEKPASGLSFNYYEADEMSADKMLQLQPVKTGVVNNFNLDNKNRKSKFGFIYTGYINIVKTGIYDFYTESDDGSLLFIDEQLIIDNNGNHGMEEKTGKAILEKGMHKIKLIYYDGAGDNGLKVSFSVSGQNKFEVPAAVLFH
jgi:hypothetical protein